MKKMIGLSSVLAAALSALLLVGCFGRQNAIEERRAGFGLGVYSYYGTPTDADGDVDGECEATLCAAAVYVGEDGRIKKCILDCMVNTLAYTSDGKYVSEGDFKTKRELGDSYGMKAGGASREWYEQADIFESLVKDKTLDEVKKFVAEGGRGSDEVIAAGCTISVSDFVKAVELAVNTAKDTDASAEDEMRLGIISASGASFDAADGENGISACDSTFFAAMLDDDGVVTACRCDAAEARLPFDKNGEAELEAGKALESKRVLGDRYGMKAGGASREWYEQADALEAECTGKNAAGIMLLEADDGYGVDTLQKAGCTVKVTELVRCAVKAVK